MESIMTNKKYQASKEPIGYPTDEDDIMKLFDQLSSLTSPMLDWLTPDTIIVINEASLQGKSTTYKVKIQNLQTIALLDTGANITVVSEKFFNSPPQKLKLSKVHTHKATSSSGASLGPIGQSTTYKVKIQNLQTIALLDTGANIKAVSEKFFNSPPQKPKLSKVHTHKETSSSGASLGPIGQCDLTFQLGNKCFLDRFIVLQDLWWNLV